MASSAAERKAKQRQEMLEKGFERKDFWITKESLEIIDRFKKEHALKSRDEALNQLLQKLK